MMPLLSDDARGTVLDEMNSEQRIALLKLLDRGAGYAEACVRLGIDYCVLKRTLARNPVFREASEQLEQFRMDTLLTVVQAAALKGDVRAAMFLIARHDRDVRRRDRDRAPRGRKHRRLAQPNLATFE